MLAYIKREGLDFIISFNPFPPFFFLTEHLEFKIEKNK